MLSFIIYRHFASKEIVQNNDVIENINIFVLNSRLSLSVITRVNTFLGFKDFPKV
jgi:hypothetical protein